MRMLRIALVATVAIVGVATEAPRAGACSCVAPPTVEAWVQTSEVVFVATIDAVTADLVYTMTVEQVLKPAPGFFTESDRLYTESDRQVTVQGGDASGGCGPDYGAVGDRAAVFGRRDDDGVTIVGSGCNSYGPVDLERIAPVPSNPGGRAVALATLPHGWANVVALDVDGEIVASNYADVRQLAACPSQRAVGLRDGSFVYLNIGGLRVPSQRIALDFVGSEHRVWCRTNDAGDRAIVVVGRLADETGITVQRDDNAAYTAPDASDAIVDLDGRIWLMPARRGEPMRALSGVSGGQVGSFDLGDDVVVAAAFDERDSVAMLVAPDERVTVETRATAIQIVRFTADGPVLAGRIELPTDGPWPRSILMTDQVFVVGESVSTGRVETLQYDVDGTLVAAHAGEITSVARVGDETWAGTEPGIVRIGADGSVETIVVADANSRVPPTVVGLPTAARVRRIAPPAYELVDFDDAVFAPRGHDDEVSSTWDGLGPLLVFAGLLTAALAGSLVALARRHFSFRRH